MDNQPVKKKKRLPKHAAVVINCGPGPNCKQASLAAAKAISAILRSENLSGNTQDCKNCQQAAIRPELLNP